MERHFHCLGLSSGSVVHHTLLWSVYLIFFLLFTSREWPNANLRFIAATFVFVALILGLLCVFDYLTVVDFTSSEGPIRIRYGKYAELLVTISPLLWALAIYGRNQSPRRLLLIAGIISWLTVMLSLSKGAFIAGIIGFALFFTGCLIFSSRLFRRRIIAFAGIWVAVTIATQIFFSFFSAVPSTTNYITGAADQTRSTSTMRLFTWSVARQMASITGWSESERITLALLLIRRGGLPPTTPERHDRRNRRRLHRRTRSITSRCRFCRN